jgi:hypothetical protein
LPTGWDEKNNRTERENLMHQLVGLTLLVLQKQMTMHSSADIASSAFKLPLTTDGCSQS